MVADVSDGLVDALVVGAGVSDAELLGLVLVTLAVGAAEVVDSLGLGGVLGVLLSVGVALAVALAVGVALSLGAALSDGRDGALGVGVGVAVGVCAPPPTVAGGRSESLGAGASVTAVIGSRFSLKATAYSSARASTRFT